MAERALVARLLIEPSLVAEATALSPEDFSHSDLESTFREILRRHNDGHAIDAVLVGDATGVEIDVLELSPASFAPVEQYVTAIQDAAFRRKQISILDQAKEQIRTGGDAVATVTRAIEQTFASRSAKGIRTAGQVVQSFREDFPTRGAAGIPFGIAALDSALLPMRAGRLVVFASRPGIGKTALAESVGDSAAEHGPVLFVSLEMMAEELLDRSLARKSGIKAQEIIRGTADLKELDDHLVKHGEGSIYYVDEGGTTTDEIFQAAQRVKMENEGRLSLIIVDYIQLVGDKGENEVYRVGGISHALKRMAKRLQVPVLAAAQLNRQIEMGSRPSLSSIRDSDAIGQDADVVLVMTGQPYKPERELHILKQRQGSTGVVNLMFDGDTQRWESPEPERKLSW